MSFEEHRKRLQQEFEREVRALPLRPLTREDYTPRMEEIEQESHAFWCEEYERERALTHFFEGGEWHERTYDPGPTANRWFWFLAFVSFMMAIGHWVLGNGTAWFSGRYWSVAPFVFSGLFFLFLLSLSVVARMFPTQASRNTAVLVSSVATLALLWSGWFFVLAHLLHDNVPSERNPIVLNRVDKLNYEHNLEGPESEQIPRGGPSLEELEPFLDYNFLGSYFPKPTTVTTPDGETIEGHLFETEEQAASFYALTVPFLIALFFIPAIYLSVPFIDQIAQSITKLRYYFYVGVLLALVVILSLGFVPDGVDKVQTTILTSILGFSALAFYLLIHCSVDNVTRWKAAHCCAAAGGLFIAYLMHHIGFYDRRALAITFLFSLAIMVHMALPSVLSRRAWQRTQRVFHVLGLCFRWAPIVIIFMLTAYSWWVGPRETGNNPVDQWITTPSEQPAE